jgi:hypothetical protein
MIYIARVLVNLLFYVGCQIEEYVAVADLCMPTFLHIHDILKIVYKNGHSVEVWRLLPYLCQHLTHS